MAPLSFSFIWDDEKTGSSIWSQLKRASPLLTLSLRLSLRLCSNLWIYKPASDWLFGRNVIDFVWRLDDKTQGHSIAERVGYLITQRCSDDVCPKPNLHSRLRTQTGYRPASSRMGWYWLTPTELWLGLLVPSRLHSSTSPPQNSSGRHTTCPNGILHVCFHCVAQHCSSN